MTERNTKSCEDCGEVWPRRRTKCKECGKLLCRGCIHTSAKDLGGPLCSACGNGTTVPSKVIDLMAALQTSLSKSASSEDK